MVWGAMRRGLRRQCIISIRCCTNMCLLPFLLRSLQGCSLDDACVCPCASSCRYSATVTHWQLHNNILRPQTAACKCKHTNTILATLSAAAATTTKKQQKGSRSLLVDWHMLHCQNIHCICGSHMRCGEKGHKKESAGCTQTLQRKVAGGGKSTLVLETTQGKKAAALARSGAVKRHNTRDPDAYLRPLIAALGNPLCGCCAT